MSFFKKRTNCLFIATETEAASGGVGFYNDSFISGLEKDFFEKVIVYGAHDKNIREGGVSLPLVNNILPKKLINSFILIFKLLFTPIETIICAHVFLLPVVLPLTFIRGKKLILIVYGIDCWGGRIEKYKSFYKMIDKIVSISEFTTSQLLLQAFPKEKIVKIPPLVDFTDAPAEINRSKKDTVEILTVGRMSTLEKYKGHREVLKAVSELKKRMVKVHYHVAGSGDDLPALKELAKELGIRHEVTFHGFVSNEKLDELYRQCDIFTMPSQVSTLPHDLKGEGFGIVFVEAAKYRLAVIGPDCGGSDDIILDGKTGLMVNPESPIEIADKVEKLVDDPGLRKVLGENLFEHCEKLFSLDKRSQYLGCLFGRVDHD